MERLSGCYEGLLGAMKLRLSDDVALNGGSVGSVTAGSEGAVDLCYSEPQYFKVVNRVQVDSSAQPSPDEPPDSVVWLEIGMVVEVFRTERHEIRPKHFQMRGLVPGGWVTIVDGEGDSQVKYLRRERSGQAANTARLDLLLRCIVIARHTHVLINETIGAQNEQLLHASGNVTAAADSTTRVSFRIKEERRST